MLECSLLLLFPIFSSPPFYCRQQVILSKHDGYVVYPFVPFLIMMVVLGNQSTNDKEDEEIGSDTYCGKEEVGGGDDHETDSDDGKKSKETSTPLWKYVTKLVGGKRG